MSFLQFAHGLLVDIENVARHHSEPLPSFNPPLDDVKPSAEPVNAAPSAPVADVPAVDAPPATNEALVQAEHTPAPDGQNAHTPAPDAPAAPATTDAAPAADAAPKAE